MRQSFNILYEDEFLLLVDKPAGIPVIPGRTEEMNRSLKYNLKEKYGDIYVVHRIDEETSGLVIFAKDADTHRKINTMFQNRKISKKYLAITRGIPHQERASIKLPLKKLNNQNKSVTHKDGKEAHTEYEVVEQFKNASLIEVEIHTGRHHQIRVHLKTIGNPLLVDKVYGQNGFFLSEIKHKKYKIAKDKIERPLLNRLSLHAFRLSFEHPMTSQKVEIEAPLPKDLRATLNQLRKNI